MIRKTLSAAVIALGLPASAETYIEGTVSGVECGDNCYLYLQVGDTEVPGLCHAPECEPWTDAWYASEEQPDIMGQMVRASIAIGDQYDGGGNKMGEMLAYQSIALVADTAQSFGAADLDGDGQETLFILSGIFATDIDADLVVIDGYDTRIYPEFAWAGAMFGLQPQIEAAGNAIRIVTMNTSIGRGRWRQTLTVGQTEESFAITHFVHDWYDTLDPDGYGTCTMDLAGGKASLTVAGEPVSAKPPPLAPIALADWQPDLWPPAYCDN